MKKINSNLKSLAGSHSDAATEHQGTKDDEIWLIGDDEVTYGDYKTLEEIAKELGKTLEAMHKSGEISIEKCKVRRIDISNNNVKSIPQSIGKLEDLHKLDISRNSIVEIPQSLKNLKKLRELDVSGNSLVEIPEFICCFRYLVSFDASDNALKYLPDKS
ncbi:MAG: leucine-rich repeat domain-containing protein [Candidatus Aenigmarchaeota archaeon]|nr:leucine-rich repeat domain-containing protein [Candidatus Aenigmarchaeota archaeon]